MKLDRIQLRNFLGYAAADIALDEVVHLVTGPNGRGKSSIANAVEFALTGLSPEPSDAVGPPRVAEAPVARTWYGLDVTLQCRLHRDEVRQRFRGPLLEAVYRFAEVWFRRREHIVFHDPLAAAAIFEPSLCTLRPARVEVQTAGEFPGRTVPHEADRPEADRIATTVNAKAFFDHYFAVTA